MRKIIGLVFVFILSYSIALMGVEVLFNTQYAPYSFQEEGVNKG